MSDVFLKDSGRHILSLYGKLADIEQEKKEAPGKFLDRLREALHRFTEIDPESEEGKVILPFHASQNGCDPKVYKQ